MNTVITSARYVGNGQKSIACHGLQGMHGIIVNTNKKIYKCLLCEEDGMSDLIDRQAAIDAARQYCIDNLIEDADYHSDGIEYELNNLPSAEPEIIRCKDCRYYRRMIDQDDLCKYRQMQVFDDDFCSRAERRIDEAD